MNDNRIIFIGWDGFDQRNEGYCAILEAEPVYVGRHHPNRLMSILSWIPKFFSTAKHIRKLKPDIVIIKNTQWVIALSALLLRVCFGYRLALDSHSCAFDGGVVYPGWMHRMFCRWADLSLVTNNADRDQILQWGGRVHVIPFPPVRYDDQPTEDVQLEAGFHILFAHTYATDEPYREVIDAVEQVPGVTIHITGNTAKAAHPLADHPRIKHTGFISRERYLGLMKACDAVMTLTYRDNTMQKAGNEAVFTGRPLITSDLPFLHTYFARGTVFVDMTPDGIAAGIRHMMENRSEYEQEMETFAKELWSTNRDRVLNIVSLLRNESEENR